MSKQEFYPKWIEEAPSEKSYRSIFKWGDPREFKHPNKRLYKLMKETFDMTDADFKTPRDLGYEIVGYDIPSKLSKAVLDELARIVGAENVKTDDYTRLEVAYGKTMIDLLRLRKKQIENLPDAVLYPRNKEDIVRIVRFCDEKKIPVYVYGGGSGVTRGAECIKGGISLDIRKHFNKVLYFNETNQTITVEAGIDGPTLEATLNNAKEIFGARRNYTCGHFPQSFEYSVVGGWVVTRGAGQNSTYYGKIEDIVIAQEYVTPAGIIKTGEYPAMATGPSVDQIMMGSEGAYGILVSATLKVRRLMPKNTRRFSFVFPDWDKAVNAVREVMQGEFGFPSVFRLSDPEETDVAMKLYGVEGTVIDSALKLRGYKPGRRCLLLGTSDGDASFTRLVKRKVKRIAKRYGAMNTTGYVTRMWEHGRFRDPYLREDLGDFGIVIDTLECAVNWVQLTDVHSSVREYCKSRPKTVCMTHISHCYPQGANLYFIFIGRMEMVEYKEYHRGLLDAIQKSGAAMSHHHGIGKLFAPWLEGQIGSENITIFRALKRHFDPNGIMNPGGTLALD
jgi:alkyldihydroxyacetonephosphate synthase